MTEHYDVALSFAGEDRRYVEMVADCLKARGVKVFYDKFEVTNLWGRNLQEHFSEVFGGGAKCVVMFVSADYRDKMWPKLERRAALAEAMKSDGIYVLPARFDGTDLPGLPHTVGYLDLRSISPTELSIRICEKLGKPTLMSRADEVPPPSSKTTTGRVSFNYSSFNGRFVIGNAPYDFTTRWSKASNTSIHCYIDGTNVRGVALAPRKATVASLEDAGTLDFTSRNRTPEIGRVVVLQNTQGYFAALTIVAIKDDTRGDDTDELTFDYVILVDGGANFQNAIAA